MDKAEATAARNVEAQREAEARPIKQRADRGRLVDEQNAAQAQRLNQRSAGDGNQ